MKLVMKALILVGMLTQAVSIQAQIERYVVGTHYTELPTPVNTLDASKVEVLEAFWYGCSHCFRFEPLIMAWEEDLGDDVDFVRFPASWNPLMKVHAQIYYTAETLDVVEVLHQEVYKAINVQGNRLANEGQIADLFAEHGISTEDFESAFNSFSVRTRVNQAEKRMSDYQIRSTPNLIINGKYLVTTGEVVRTQEEMLQVADFLIEKERSALGAPGD
ncbi:MAG: thiol:disulfide interchange protein DsbA/DsbL [Gammaproteobacteria bacterium]|nr:thiol:disulfide interchange protein DsbA/DsbL [Gammaproteobacteria bacterium]